MLSGSLDFHTRNNLSTAPQALPMYVVWHLQDYGTNLIPLYPRSSRLYGCSECDSILLIEMLFQDFTSVSVPFFSHWIMHCTLGEFIHTSSSSENMQALPHPQNATAQCLNGSIHTWILLFMVLTPHCLVLDDMLYQKDCLKGGDSFLFSCGLDFVRVYFHNNIFTQTICNSEEVSDVPSVNSL